MDNDNAAETVNWPPSSPSSQSNRHNPKDATTISRWERPGLFDPPCVIIIVFPCCCLIKSTCQVVSRLANEYTRTATDVITRQTPWTCCCTTHVSAIKFSVSLMFYSASLFLRQQAKRWQHQSHFRLWISQLSVSQTSEWQWKTEKQMLFCLHF